MADDEARRREIAQRVLYWMRRRGMTRQVFADRMERLVRLRDPGSALDFARTIDLSALGMLPRERRANYYLDVANANLQRGRNDAAVAALVQADRTAPEEVRCRPVSRYMIADLLKVTRTPSPGLRRLGAAAGLAV